MKREVLNAIRVCIKNREKELAAIKDINNPNWAGVRLGTSGCALCRLFHTGVEYSSCCVGCPVLLRTGRKYCARTPYERIWRCSTAGDPTRTRLGKAVAAEIAFLKSLLPRKPAKATTARR